jgi:hypothetical protein
VPPLEPGELRFLNRWEYWPTSQMTGFLLASTWNWDVLHAFITEQFTRIEGADWQDVAEQLSVLASWEGETSIEPRRPRFGRQAGLPVAFASLDSPAVPGSPDAPSASTAEHGP